MKGRLLFILLLPSLFELSAQIDSLKSALNATNSDTVRIELMIEIGNRSEDSSRFYLNESLRLARAIGWGYGEAGALSAIGMHLYRAQHLDSTISLWNQALNVYSYELETRPTNRVKDKIASLNYNLAIRYYINGEYLRAIASLKSSLDLYIELENSNKIIPCYNLLGGVYYIQDDIDQAYEQYIQALQYALELKNNPSASNAYNNIGSVFVERKQYQDALDNFELSLSIYPQQDSVSHYQTTANIGQVYTQMGRYEEAENTLLQSISFFETSGNLQAEIICLTFLGDLYVAIENWTEVLKYASKCYELSAEYGMQYQQQEAAQHISKAYEALGNDSKALVFYKEFATLRDSLFNQDKIKEVEVLKAQLEFDKQEREIGELTQSNLEQEVVLSQERNTRNAILFSAAALLLIIGVIWVLYRRKEERKRHSLELKKLEIEQRMLRSQMNPHFIFNALNSIQSFITTNNTYEAEIFMSKFSMLVRRILENSTHESISLEEEIETLKIYLELEKSRFEERFDFHIVDDADDTLPIPPMLLQPFIENAIIHGMKGKSEKGNIWVRFIETDDFLQCEVEDDGVGRGKLTHHSEHKSLATSLTNDRITYFNDATSSESYQLEIIDKHGENNEPSGTKVVLNIPLN